MGLRLLLFAIVVLSLDYYAFQAFRLLLPTKGTLRFIIFLIYWSIPAFVFTQIIVGPNLSEKTLHSAGWVYLRSVLIMLYVSKVVLSLGLLLDDIRRIFTWIGQQFQPQDTAPSWPSRSRFITRLALLVGAAPLSSLLYGMLRNAYRYKVYSVPVALPKLPQALDGLKIVQISDIHSGSFLRREAVKKAVKLINAQKPDLIFFTGDLVNNKAAEMEDYLSLFAQIRARYGVFSVLGNHDYGDYYRWPSPQAKRENLERLKAMHAEMGWQLLLNANQPLTINNEKISIIGVENIAAQGRFHTYGDLQKAYQGTEDAALKLLLSHDPSHWDAEVNQDPAFQDIQITFAGHTRGTIRCRESMAALESESVYL